MANQHRHRFFPSLEAEVEERLRSIGTPLQLGAGETAIEEGSLDRCVYLVESGKFSVVQRGAEGDILVGTISAGDVFGEISFLDSRPRSASVRSTVDSQIVRVERQQALKTLSDSPETLRRFLQDLSDRASNHLEDRQNPDLDREETGKTDGFLDQLQEEALQHRGVRHPYLEALASGSLPDPRWALRDFARHYTGFASHFPRFLTGVISSLPSAQERASLLEYLTAESGAFSAEELEELVRSGIEKEWIEGYPRPILLERFCEAIGVGNIEPEDDAVEVICWREMFFSILHGGSPAEALGALGFATEGVVGEVYRCVMEAIELQGDIDPRDSVFFHLHTLIDSKHRDALRKVSAAHAGNSRGRRDLQKGMNKALSLRGAFWDWLHSRAVAVPSHGIS